MKLLGLALLLGPCISTAMDSEPQWLLDARAKEGQLIAPHLVTSVDKRISFSVPVALSGALKESKDSYEAFLTLGPAAAAAAECGCSALKCWAARQRKPCRIEDSVGAGSADGGSDDNSSLLVRPRRP